MTDYSNVPQTNALYTEQQQVRAAMTYLTNGGVMSSMTIGPPPIPPYDPNNPVPTPQMMGMAVTIVLPTPTDPDLINAAMAALQARDDAITQELADLGVTNTPPSRTRRK